MVEYRQLEDWEVKTYTDALLRNSEELELYTWEADNKKRSLNNGLRISFLALKRKTEVELAQLEQAINESKQIVDDCESKLKFGVPIKEASDEVDDDGR